MERLKGLEAQMLAAPDQQISLTDPDSRSMATSGRGSGVVGYNVQVSVDTEHHLIVTHVHRHNWTYRATFWLLIARRYPHQRRSVGVQLAATSVSVSPAMTFVQGLRVRLVLTFVRRIMGRGSEGGRETALCTSGWRTPQRGPRPQCPAHLPFKHPVRDGRTCPVKNYS
jgi:hypothetical protein